MKIRTMIGAIAALLFIAVGITAQLARAQSADPNAKAPKCTPNIPSKGDVLVTAGEDINQNETGQTEFFHPATGAWETGCPSKSQHDEGELLPFKGGLLEIGGEQLKQDKLHDHLISKSAELYNPATGTFKSGPALKTPLEDFAAVVLADGSLMVAGGTTSNDKELAVQTIETLSKGGWKTLKNKLSVPRSGPCAALMTAGAQAGQVLIAGGTSASEEDPPELASSDVFDPAKGTVTATTSPMNLTRSFEDCTALNDGTVLVSGGYTNDSFVATDTAEIYNPANGSFTFTNNTMSNQRAGHIAVLLNDGTVLVAGGDTGTSIDKTADLYDPTTGKFTPLPDMNDFHDYGSANLIAGSGTALDGEVLIEGGFTAGSTENTAELYDPVHQTFTFTSNMNFNHGESNSAVIP